MKDNFSTHSSQYAQFRPKYPKAFYDFILENSSGREMAWDCATGNGQVAVELANFFDMVYATDISVKQLQEAPQRENIRYLVEPAEHSSFKADSFNLVTVAQAIHWFNFEIFFAEVKRVLKPNGLFVAVGYGLMRTDPELDEVIWKLYHDVLGAYWDIERRHIEAEYATIPFPFSPLQSPSLSIVTTWSFDQLIGYLNTWSSLQHYARKNAHNPLDYLKVQLRSAWGKEEFRSIGFPLIIKAGKLR